MTLRFFVAFLVCLSLSAVGCMPEAPAESPADAPEAESAPAPPVRSLDRWNLGQGNVQGHPTILRVRTGLARVAGDENYPTRVEIVADFLDPRDDGMPQPDDARALGPIEDEIVKQFDIRNEGLLAAVITGNGARTYILMSKRSNVDAAFAAVKVHAGGHELHLRVEADPAWKRFLELDAALRQR
ncbi:DUF695 domain-containing protein [Pendulispora brunnea]|uniref:DUF695 domain-containing protein n=1 Tax=Pendulispora brunnea TaxID=2905690 RepID=A0ABZ2JY89_9BACT